MPVNNSKKCSAFAAIDIGTSYIKCGVSISGIKNSFRIIGRYQNQTISTIPGQALNSFSKIEDTVAKCLKDLGSYCQEHQIKTLHIGICGHVSSYLNWDKESDSAVNDSFPIWSDQSCEPVLPAIKEILGGNKDEEYLGTFLPPASNWLISKVLYHHNDPTGKNMILQIADAVFHRLTGFYYTHFSSAVSLVHQLNHEYSKNILDALNLSAGNLPEIDNTQFFTIRDELRKAMNLPEQTFVSPGIADFYASFAALDLKCNEGFVLSNTSEIAGKLLSNEQIKPKNFLLTYIQQDRPILYGSTQTGGNIINWFFEKIYCKPLNFRSLSDLSVRASKISSLSCPLFIPYLEGERAPFWNNNLRGGFINLKSHHGLVHLFKAVLVGIAFARRFSFESMPGELPEFIKIGGGGARNSYWNQIRADVLGKPFLVFKESELSMLGTIYLMSVVLSDDKMIQNISNLQKAETLYPDMEMTELFQNLYIEFINNINFFKGGQLK